mgnify:CR=1 FL=1
MNRAALHRIREVRRSQGVSLARISRALRVPVKVAKQQEDEASDLSLSELYAWRQVLNVPIAELLVESDAGLSKPVVDRARMIKLMKTAVTNDERATSSKTAYMAENLIDQLHGLMPEVGPVSAWPAAGKRRGEQHCRPPSDPGYYDKNQRKPAHGLRYT